MLTQGDYVLRLPVTKNIKYVEENLEALTLELRNVEQAEIRGLGENAEVHGERYSEAMAGHLFAAIPASKA